MNILYTNLWYNLKEVIPFKCPPCLLCVCFEVMDELCLCFSTKSLALFPTWWVQLARSRGVSSFTASTSTAKPIYCFMNKPASNVFKELKNLLLEWLKLILTIHFWLKGSLLLLYHIDKVFVFKIMFLNTRQFSLMLIKNDIHFDEMLMRH